MEEEIYRSAKKTVKLKKDFYGHLIGYILFNFVMFYLVFFSGGLDGFRWLMLSLPWGIVVAVRYFKAFGNPSIGIFNSDEWERKEVQKEMEKEYEKYDWVEEKLELKELNRSYRRNDLV